MNCFLKLQWLIKCKIHTHIHTHKKKEKQSNMTVLVCLICKRHDWDRYARVACTISKFDDDSKLRGAVDSLEGQKALQRVLGRLEHRAVINGIKFNKLKCWILHLGWINAGPKYKLGEEWLGISPAERDSSSV